MKTLKPCPFCGAYPDVGIYPESEDSPRGYFCKCPACLADTSMSSDRATAIAAWNRRADPLVEELRGALIQGAEWFEEYADHHQAKGALDKASRNLERANYLRRREALALPVGNISARDLAPTITDARVSCDADHADKLAEVAEAARLLIVEGLRLTPSGLIVRESSDRSDPHYRLCCALEDAGLIPQSRRRGASK